MFGRIDHIGVAVEDIDAAIALYEQSFEMELAHRETVESQGVEAVLLDVGDGHVELLRPLGPDTAVGKFLARKGPGLHHVAYAVDDIDATLRRGRRRRHRADRRRGPGRHPRQPRRLPAPALDRRRADRDRRAGGGPLMADAQRVEIGFEGGQVVSARLTAEDLKDLRKAVEKGGWQDVHTDDGVLSVYLGKVVFLRIDSGEHRVGFSQAADLRMKRFLVASVGVLLAVGLAACGGRAAARLRPPASRPSRPTPTPARCPASSATCRRWASRRRAPSETQIAATVTGFYDAYADVDGAKACTFLTAARDATSWPSVRSTRPRARGAARP